MERKEYYNKERQGKEDKEVLAEERKEDGSEAGDKTE